jgi:hypothetical protein
MTNDVRMIALVFSCIIVFIFKVYKYTGKHSVGHILFINKNVYIR